MARFDQREQVLVTTRLKRLYPMESLQNIPRRILQRDGTAVRAAHGVVGGCQRRQQPLHLGLIEPHVDLDGRAAGDRRRHVAPDVLHR